MLRNRFNLNQKPARHMSSSLKLPRLIAFDLDATLWVPEMYELHGGAPFRRDVKGRVFDKSNTEITLMGNSRSLLHRLATEEQFSDVRIAYVSRTEYPEWALPCLQTFLITDTENKTMLDISSFQEIYPGCKKRHFKAIREKSQIAFSDMLFFDNEWSNIRDCNSLGILSIHTPDGMTEAKWEEGLREFSKR